MSSFVADLTPLHQQHHDNEFERRNDAIADLQKQAQATSDASVRSSLQAQISKLQSEPNLIQRALLLLHDWGLCVYFHREGLTDIVSLSVAYLSQQTLNKIFNPENVRKDPNN